jgi:exopolyphosphatase / guanosine-5'-triphosphate,3'-diphosphate pyrophosphatase
VTDSTDGFGPQHVEIRNGKASSSGAGTAADGETGQGGGKNVAPSDDGGGNPSRGIHATASPDSWKSGKKRRRRRRGRSKPSQTADLGDQAPAEHAGAAPEASSEAASAPRHEAEARRGDGPAGSPGKSPKARKRRRRGRGSGKPRELQGHPLAAREARSAQSKSSHGDAASLPAGGNPQQVRPQLASGGQNGVSAAAAQDQDLYAALDLGTNNCRLLIAQPTRPGQFRVVDAFSRIVRLGEGLAASGRLSEGAMERSVEALKVCASKISGRNLRLKRLIATEACRSASNGTEFLKRVHAETGLDLEIVDRETEARLAVAGCTSLIDRETDGLVLFDIGGGSSEIALIDLSTNRTNRLSDHIRAWTSLPVGVVTLSERYGGSAVTREIFDAMVTEVDNHLASFMPSDLPGIFLGGNDLRFHLLGTSGTVTTLAGLHLELPRYDRRKVDGVWLTSSEVDVTLERLLSWDFDQRAANPCIGADRADLVLAGCAILESIRKRWPSERMRVADRGLREGLLNEMMARDGAWRRAGRRYRARMRARPTREGES